MQETLGLLAAKYGIAILEFGAWLAGGLVLQQIISAFLRNAATRNQSRAKQALVVAARGTIAWIGGLIGFWMAYYTIIRINARNELALTLIKNRHWFFAATILLVTFFAARTANRYISAYTARESTKVPKSSIFGNIVAAAIYIIGISSAVIVTGSSQSLTPLLGALGVSGLAIGLALQPTLDNLFSGVQILASRQIEPGDYVRLESQEEGMVEDVTWRNTTIRRITGELVIVPNSLLAKSQVVNFSRNADAFNLLIPTLVAYGNDVEKVSAILNQAAAEIMQESHYVHKEQEPRVIVTANTERGVSFTTVLPIVAYNMRGRVTSQYLSRVQQRFLEQDIAQPTPAATVD